MKILLTNDDGIHAPGLKVLEKIARTISDDITIVAPEVEQSGKSRAVTLTEPLRVREIEPKVFSVTGTPSDCVLLAMRDLMPEPPELILSGVNKGQNIAEDTSYSGTIAAAMFGMQHNVPSIALSQSQNFRGRGSCPWETAELWGARALKPVLENGWPSDVVININFPDLEAGAVQGVEIARQGHREHHELYTEERMDLRQRRYYWFGFSGKAEMPPEGTDLRAVKDGKIAVTPIHIDLTHEGSMSALKGMFQD